VEDLPKNVPTTEDPTIRYSFRAEHLPEKDNYSHTEVVIDKEEKRMQRLRSDILMRELREQLAYRLRLYRGDN
jgi:hypothetical protein